MTPFAVQVLVGIVAAASLVLGLYNLWFAKQAPVRERQRELEDEVREKLTEVLHAVDAEMVIIKRGEYKRETVPPEISATSESIRKIAPRLIEPGLVWRTKNAADMLFLLSSQWSPVASDHKYPDQTNDRRKAANEESLKEFLLQCRPSLDELVTLLVKREQGK
ncbi:hypothetical protein [Rhodococcus sp. IEGM 1374]|uniref:hypothetical protein n=1 Tax=Rhodococcus sp. IEGM 1374 TaxID=3082221 RepID=UPI002953F845|nr:hypothetical protein [Rhodococcus sp. IEGM 1374]MDV7992088.1 hypothetical protein [Rhodococcus sp. IEGM 1374]